MKFTGQATFEWRYEGNDHNGLYFSGAKIGCAYPVDNGYYQSLVLTETYRYSLHPTLEEAKAALLAALGITAMEEG